MKFLAEMKSYLQGLGKVPGLTQGLKEFCLTGGLKDYRYTWNGGNTILAVLLLTGLCQIG